MCVDWVNALFMMAGLDNAQEKVLLSKNDILFKQDNDF
jgi:hypothetical protein